MTDYDFVNEQCQRAKLGPDLTYVVTKLLQVMDLASMPARSVPVVIDAFSALAQGHALPVAESDEKWGPVIPGAYRIGDTVRVRLSAYDGAKGEMHNGKRGRVTAARDGFCVVLYDGSPSVDLQHYHKPEYLQRLAVV